MSPDLMRQFVERHIAETRPRSAVATAAGLVMAGLIVARMSIVFLFPGLFLGGPVLVLGLLIVGAGFGCVLLAWSICRGHAWSWYAAILSPVAWLAFVWWISQAYPDWTTALLVLVLALQPLLWHGATRRWVFRAHWLRSHGFDGVTLATAGPSPRRGEAPGPAEVSVSGDRTA